MPTLNIQISQREVAYVTDFIRHAVHWKKDYC